MNARDWFRPLEFGDGEPLVRIIEESSAEQLTGELAKALGKKATEDDLYLAAGRAALRSVRQEGPGSGKNPVGLYLLNSHRDLGARLPPDLRPYPLSAVARRVRAEIYDPAYGPTRLLRFTSIAHGSKEEIRDAYLEAVLLGDSDTADHIFLWLLENLPPEEISDLLWTGGLEKVCLGSFKLLGAVETFHLAQALGWETAGVLLRGPVRHQSHRLVGPNPFPDCRDRIAAESLHQRAHRRLPGERGRGEDDPTGIWETALLWGSISPEERTTLAVRSIGGEWSLEDFWEAVSLGAAILFLGATSAGVPVVEAVRQVVAVGGMRVMLRTGNLGQKILASLLVGRTRGFEEPARQWVDQGVQLLEGSLRASKLSIDELGAALDGWQADAALGCVASASADLERVGGIGAILEHRLAFLDGLDGLGPLFHRVQTEAFQAGRSPHRWVHLAATAWLCALWPERGVVDDGALAKLADRRRRDLAKKQRGR
ncbi:MAG: hypothetical protein GF346_05695 [Candidatus Eisenbacteria bacterium]|nr:hypothetical protein [Candidatus Latescibacterota bacterium]MBD3301921.1 hypothetical protein [Candidatus Eisenbacteria bacterium]